MSEIRWWSNQMALDEYEAKQEEKRYLEKLKELEERNKDNLSCPTGACWRDVTRRLNK